MSHDHHVMKNIYITRSNVYCVYMITGNKWFSLQSDEKAPVKMT